MKKIAFIFFLISVTFEALAQSPTTDPNKILAETQRRLDSAMKANPTLRKYMDKSNQKNASPDVFKLTSNITAANVYTKKPDTTFLSQIKIPVKDKAALAFIPSTPISKQQIVIFIWNIKKEIFKLLPPSTGQKLLDMSSYDPEVIDKGSVTAWCSGNPERALELALDAADRDPDNYSTLNNLSGILTMCGMPCFAIPILDYIRQDDPGNSTINNNLGQAYISLGDEEKATYYLKLAIADYADHPDANFTLARLAYIKGDKSMAASYCEHTIRGAFVSDAWVMLKAIKPDARLMELIKHRYKQHDYFSPHKYPVLPQCRDVANVKDMVLEYQEYRNMLMAMKDKYNKMIEAEADYVKQHLVQDVMAKVRQQKSPLRPFQPLAQSVIADLGEDLADRLKRLDKYDDDYNQQMSDLKKSHDDQLVLIKRRFEPREDAAGEGNPDVDLESDECKAMNAVHNQYMLKCADLTEDWQHQWIQQTKDYYNDYAYWCYLASTDDHQYHQMFYSLVDQWLTLMLKLNTSVMVSCSTPVTYSNNESDSLEIVEGKCPLSAKITTGLKEEGKEEMEKFATFDISCEEYKVDFELPDHGFFSVKTKANGSTTVVLGADLGYSTKESKNKVVKMLPVSASGSMGTYVRFGGSQPADIGMMYDYELNLPKPLGGKNSFGYSFGLNSMWEIHGSGPLFNLAQNAIDKLVGRPSDAPQMNKNVKIFNERMN